MNFPWAICLALEDAASLAPLRLTAGIEVGEAGRVLWLRGQAADEKVARVLQSLPAVVRCEMLAGNRLRNLEARIPAERLPDLLWQPLASWLRVELPVAVMPAVAPATVRLRLVRSMAERAADLLLADLADWVQFARTAAQVRLERLQFAAEAGGKVLVRGQPLPALPGRRFVLHGRIAVPAGFAWAPAVSAEVLMRRFGAVEGALVVWHEDGTITRLHAEQFVPATRSAIRATAAALETAS